MTTFQRSRLGCVPLREQPPRAFALVVVLVVVAMLTLAGFTFSDRMLAHRKSTRAAASQADSRLCAESAVVRIEHWAAQPPRLREQDGGWYDDEQRWGIMDLIEESGSSELRAFRIVSRRVEEQSLAGLRRGLDNESARLHLATLLAWDEVEPGAGREALLNLPGMTEEIADALLDFIDADDTPRESGAESEYYALLDPPRRALNRLPESLDELLLVRGVTHQLLYGADFNRNGTVEDFEREIAAGENNSISTNSDVGWAENLTVHSAELDRGYDGLARIDVNGDDLASLFAELSSRVDEDLARFVILYRQFGPSETTSTAPSAPAGDIDFEAPAKFSIDSLWDLVDARVAAVFSDESAPRAVDSPLASDDASRGETLLAALDGLTVAGGRRIGRLNVNLAPEFLLRGVPGLEPDVVAQIVSRRGAPGSNGGTDARRHAAWLWLEDLVSLETMKSLDRWLTTGGDVFRAQVIGYGAAGATPYRAEVVVEAGSPRSRLVSWIDLQTLGGAPARDESPDAVDETHRP